MRAWSQDRGVREFSVTPCSTDGRDTCGEDGGSVRWEVQRPWGEGDRPDEKLAGVAHGKITKVYGLTGEYWVRLGFTHEEQQRWLEKYIEDDPKGALALLSKLHKQAEKACIDMLEQSESRTAELEKAIAGIRGGLDELKN